MIQDTLCDPTDQDVFYHYCSFETFHAICESRCIRFSDVEMLNDLEERSYGRAILQEGAAALTELKSTVPELSGLDAGFFFAFSTVEKAAKLSLHPFTASFSRKPDVLSQWRAYADDGRGFCVGFSGKALKNLPASLYHVEYDRHSQITKSRDSLGALFMAYNDKAEENLFEAMVGSSIGSLLSFKNPKFAEEDEIRSVHLVSIENDGSGFQFVDKGGNSITGEVDGEKIKYRIAQGKFVAYFDLPFERNFAGLVMKEVWIGPKNTQNDRNLNLYLNAMGYREVTIWQSEVPYR